MALFSTGSSTRDTRGQLQEKRLPGGLNFDEISLELEVEGCYDTDSVSLEEGLKILDPLDYSSIANISPVHSPFSDCSSDSGVLGSTSSDFLADLFGPDDAVFQTSPLPTNPTSTSTSVKFPLPCPHLNSEEKLSSVPEPTSISKTDRTKPSVAMVESIPEKNRKNAEAARQNRLKKKRYLEELEKERSTLKTENVILKTKCHEYQSKCQKLQSEVEYLKTVLANDSCLATLIQNIPNVPGVRLTSSFASRKRPNPEVQESGPSRIKGIKRQALSGGVCLHVAKDVVSVEFCQNCSKQALSS